MQEPEHQNPKQKDPLGLRSLMKRVMATAPSRPSRPKPTPKAKEAKPSPLHQLLVRVVKQEAFLKPILDAGGLDFDRIEPGDTALPAGTVFPDALRVTCNGGTRELALVIEVQLKPDPDKTFSWDEYLARARSKLRCPSLLLVICVNGKTERWAKRTLSEIPRVEPGVVFRAQSIAKIGRTAELGAAILGAMECKQDPRLDPVPRFLALKQAYKRAPRGDSLAVMCYDVFALCFEAEVFKELEMMENGKKHFLDELYADRYQNDIRVATEEGEQRGIQEGEQRGIQKGRQEGIQKGRQEGLQEGEQRGIQKGIQEGMRASIRAMLAGRGLALGPKHAAQVDAADEATLLAWMARAGSAQTIDEVFEPSVV